MTVNAQVDVSTRSQDLSPLDQEAAEYGEDTLDTEAVLHEVEQMQDQDESNPESSLSPKAKIAPAKDDKSLRQQYRRLGTDEVLRRLESGEISGREAAEAVRGMQTKMNDVNVEFKTLQKEMRSVLEDLQAARAQQSPQADPDPDADLLSRVTPQQQQLLEAMLRRGGYVRQEELTAQHTEEQAAQFVTQAIEQGLEQYGEAFGFKDESGQFHVNPDTQETLVATLDRLENSIQGVTPLDLFRLTHFDQLIEQAKVDERSKLQTQRQQRVQQTRRGQTVQRSTNSNTRLKIYDPQKDRGDTGKVLDRAWALVKHNLPG